MFMVRAGCKVYEMAVDVCQYKTGKYEYKIQRTNQ